MEIIPTKDNVLIIPVEKKDMTIGGIHLPDNRNKGAVVEGVVAAIGTLVTMVAVGDTVIFDKHSPTLREIRGSNRMFMMKEKDIMGVYE